ncbi:AEC family transporter [Lacticaseibacillus camelliae]|uniref:AEC family permease n=1 Tax=Lacticaseibacillus camelliae DSM 22697 = JCM 13995 TaxID=1423730 RepID=A0A0R2EQQ7_9LACO|nr:AEC family transporter [Lacticaseibacillus camelliae]KRN18642.1 AEC family permease [Lacticaseibacillus camelliae DSM 22697 = JCM 13995]
MTAFLSSLGGVAEILILVAIGYGLTAIGWFDDHSSRVIAKVVTQVALPAYMIDTICSRFSAHELATLLPDLRFPVLSMALLFALSFVVARVIRVNPKRRGLFKSMFFNSNTVFIGLPVNLALFGPKSLPYVLVYYMANTTIFWTVGVYLIQRDGPQAAHFDLKQTLGKIFSPPLLGFMLGVVLVLLHVQLPSFLMATLGYVGDLTIPGSMFFIGIAMYQAGIKNIRFDREMLGVFSGRFVFAPLIMYALVVAAPVPLLMKQVFILQSCMPVMTNAPVVAKLYGADSKNAAITVSATTMFAIIVIPIVMTLVQHL